MVSFLHSLFLSLTNLMKPMDILSRTLVSAKGKKQKQILLYSLSHQFGKTPWTYPLSQSLNNLSIIHHHGSNFALVTQLPP